MKKIKKEEPQMDTDGHRLAGIITGSVEIRVNLCTQKKEVKNGQFKTLPAV